MSITNQIKNLERKRTIIIQKLPKTRFMIRGVFAKVYRRCGKINCWCLEADKGHPAIQITWSENGQQKTKTIKEEDVDWIKEATKNYREFRKLRYNVGKLNENLRVLCDQLEHEFISETKKLKNCCW